MLRYYETDSEGRITVTSEYGRFVNGEMTGNQYDFPDDFDFDKQQFYKIENGVLIECSEELEAAVKGELAEKIRSMRNHLLTQCDWTQMPDSPLAEEERKIWAQYRQALRDIPQQAGFPENIAFPQSP